jgi:DNA-binding CsgD family transcriptional regulator
VRQGGTLIVSRAVKLFPYIKKRFEELGFPDVDITGEEKDSLNRVIREKKPWLALVGSGFYQACTPYMMGRLLRDFPKLNIAAVNVGNFPDTLAAWFIWRGVKSYLNILEGYEEFHQGLQRVRAGKTYISPAVQRLMDDFPEWPKTPTDITDRQMEVLLLVCNGFIPEHIGKNMHISRATVNWHLKEMYHTFHVSSREELEKAAFSLKLVTDKDLVFYDDREPKPEPLPEWAVRKQKMERRLATKSASMRIL